MAVCMRDHRVVTVATMHDPDPLNEYNNPELLMRMHPRLFPMFRGGAEDDRESLVRRHRPFRFDKWATRLLKIRHPRAIFAEDGQFLWVVFNMLQRRMCVDQTRFKLKHALASTDISAVIQSFREEQEAREEGRPFKADANVRRLREMVGIAGSSVMGSPASRKALRVHNYGNIMRFGVGGIFLTINPADIYSF
jgi:hypothetical protein